ncbi:MAG: adenylate kinase [Patescibacteria group bacterium]|nr:adenylate kinase [Patescibacteria group bacterium]
MYNIVMLGSQGSGKGTQADRLAAKLGTPVIPVGQTLRAEVARGTGLGQAMAGYMDRGELAPSDMVYQVVADRMSEGDTLGGVVLDGYPRTLDQAEALDEMMTKLDRQISHVIYLEISKEEAIRRMSGRRVCSNPHCELNYHIEFNPPKKDPNRCDRCGSLLEQRKDDVPEAISRRLDTFMHETAPLVEFYGKRGILTKVSGEQPIEVVEKQIAQAVGLAG